MTPVEWVLVVIVSCYLVRQMFTGELTEDEDQYNGSDLHEGWPR